MRVDQGTQSIIADVEGQRAIARFAAVAFCISLVFAVFWQTTASMVEIWRRSETFQHCFVVIPIALWLVWDKRSQLSVAAPKPFWLGFLSIALFGCLWLFGVLSAAQVISQFALICLVAAVALGGVADHLVAVAGVEVHVDVGHLLAPGVEEALEQQVVADRLQVGEPEHVRHHAAGRDPAPALVKAGRRPNVNVTGFVILAYFQKHPELRFTPMSPAELRAIAPIYVIVNSLYVVAIGAAWFLELAGIPGTQWKILWQVLQPGDSYRQCHRCLGGSPGSTASRTTR